MGALAEDDAERGWLAPVAAESRGHLGGDPCLPLHIKSLSKAAIPKRMAATSILMITRIGRMGRMGRLLRSAARREPKRVTVLAPANGLAAVRRFHRLPGSLGLRLPGVPCGFLQRCSRAWGIRSLCRFHLQRKMPALASCRHGTLQRGRTASFPTRAIRRRVEFITNSRRVSQEKSCGRAGISVAPVARPRPRPFYPPTPSTL